MSAPLSPSQLPTSSAEAESRRRVDRWRVEARSREVEKKGGVTSRKIVDVHHSIPRVQHVIPPMTIVVRVSSLVVNVADSIVRNM